MIFDFVNLANGLVVNQKKLKEIDDDKDGVATIEYLKNVSKIISRICSDDNRSLGLHPAVYFYSASGRYQPTAFLAAVSLIMDLETTNQFIWFTKHRSKFEQFILEHRYFVNQIVNQFGSGFKGYSWVYKLYKEILKMVSDGTESNMAKILIANNQWRLKEVSPKPRTDFTVETKTAIVIRDSLAAAMRCNICGARIHTNSMSIDHKTRRQDEEKFGGR